MRIFNGQQNQTKTNKNKFILKDENTKPIEYLSKQIFNLIKEFSEKPQKKSSSNPLFSKYTDSELNPIN